MLSPIELVQGVFNGCPLTGNEMEALFSFAMDNLMDFGDMSEVFETSFQHVLQKKMKHYQKYVPSFKEQTARHSLFCKNQI